MNHGEATGVLLVHRGEGPDGGVVVNDYWVDPGGGLVWQSRQWGGPAMGYLRTRRLTTG